MMILKPLTCIAVVAALSACGGGARLSPAADAPATQARVFKVDTAPGVSIEVLDWGGSGRPLVFLHGGGHTAREFDEFAPRFTGRFRVIGITRRGSGGSSDVAPDSLDPLVDDIVAVLDHLELDRAVLVGHSFAGTEMALFGEKHGDRCAGLVYLDSAYDYTDPEIVTVMTESPPPPAPEMQAADSASVDAVRAWSLRTQGFSVPESEVLATRRFDARGRLVGMVPSQVMRRMGALMRTPRWDAIECPSLGMYPVVAPLETWLRYYDQLSAEERKQGEAYVRAYGAWTAGQRSAFARNPRNRVVEFPGTGHYFFLTNPDESSRAILQFLSEIGYS
jgi:non-heme chloroperoxidase